MYRADVVRSRDGYFVHVVKVPLRVVVGQMITEKFSNGVCKLTHCYLCAPPSWLYRIGWGRYKPGESGFLEDEPHWRRHSLGNLIYTIWSSLVNYGFRKEKRLLELAVAEEEVLEKFPEWRSRTSDDIFAPPADEPGDDAMRVTSAAYYGEGTDGVSRLFL